MHSLQNAPRPQADLFATSNRHSCQHAFSSGRISTSKRLAQTHHIQQLRQQRKLQVVQAAAATDVGTKAVQAIKKSVGGDVFVAGTVMVLVSKCKTVTLHRCHVPMEGMFDVPLGLQVAMVNSQHESCRSSCVTAIKSLQVGQSQTAGPIQNQI